MHTRKRTIQVGIFIFDDVELLDFAGPYEVFSRSRTTPGVESRRSSENAPFNVVTVARSRLPVTATGGVQIIPGCDFQNCSSIDVLVVPGGWGTRPLLNDVVTLEWINSIALKAQTVASVCTGSLLLARAGLLYHKAATTHWGALRSLAEIDPTIKIKPDHRVVVDTVVSSAGVSAGIDMSLYLVEYLLGREVADDTAHYMEYQRPAVAAATVYVSRTD